MSVCIGVTPYNYAHLMTLDIVTVCSKHHAAVANTHVGWCIPFHGISTGTCQRFLATATTLGLMLCFIDPAKAL